MIRRPPRSTRTDTLFPYTTLFRSVDSLLDGNRIRSLPSTSRKRVETLLPAIVSAAAKTGNPHATAVRLLDLVENIAQRSAYLALLAEYPETLARVARIIGASPWASQYLSRYPILLDSLIEWRRSEEHTSELQSLLRISYA